MLTQYVRLMHKEDIDPVTEIDREAFPGQWPPPNYKYELKNRLAHYIVACDEEKPIEQPEVSPKAGESSSGFSSMMKRLFNNHRFFNNEHEPPPPHRHYLTGFTGFWVLADEAHITAIAVRDAYRRQGIGELLLISVISLAAEFNARIVTLEARASNTVAQNLYLKYGFSQVGVRRGYYIDNKEDGIIMSTQDIMVSPFQEHLQRLKQVHSRKYGVALYQIIR